VNEARTLEIPRAKPAIAVPEVQARAASSVLPLVLVGIAVGMTAGAISVMLVWYVFRALA
jgi:hypothetical protein